MDEKQYKQMLEEERKKKELEEEKNRQERIQKEKEFWIIRGSSIAFLGLMKSNLIW